VSPRSATPRQRPSIRLIFDELLPWRVAEALEMLQFRTTYVGNQHHSNVPSRGSSDEEVLSYAQKTNRVIATSDHGMILLCAEHQQSVIWVDPRGRLFRREDLVLLVFKNISDWHDRLRQAGSPVCLRAMRTKTVTLSMEDAHRLVHQRMRRISAARKQKKPQRPLGPLLSPEENPK